MSALYTALLEGETKESLVLMVCELREEKRILQRLVYKYVDPFMVNAEEDVVVREVAKYMNEQTK